MSFFRRWSVVPQSECTHFLTRELEEVQQQIALANFEATSVDTELNQVPEEVKQRESDYHDKIELSCQITEKQLDTGVGEHQRGPGFRQTELSDAKEAGDRKKRARQKLKRLEVVDIDKQTKDSSLKESSPLESESVASVTLNFDGK